DGGDGNDTLDGGFGFDVLIGGNGTDIATYSFFSGPIIGNLQTGVVSFPGNSTTTESLFSIENLTGGSAADQLIGNSVNNVLDGGLGNDILTSSNGNDTLNGNTGIDQANYSSLGRAITLTPFRGIDKSGVGFDQLISVEQIVGAIGQTNTINASSATGSASINVNLGINNLTVNNVPQLTSTFTVQNFVNVTGTLNGDFITGNSSNNSLNGNSGNDIVVGGGGSDILLGDSGNDSLTGTNNLSRGSGEFDTLTGGAGIDRFILGDSSGSYYKSAGGSDSALITDFSSDDLIQLGSGETYNIQTNLSGFQIFVVNSFSRELVATIQNGSSLRSDVSGVQSSISGTISTPSLDLPSGNFQLASGQVLGSFVGA
ncbi:hypothetical protein NG798_26470, partial [Ancylothrix sp. C2]|uniref:calcium-binding protein n=1 Tax=Ancylothrix sp. D3o TaxID=2953691 RepID=UPI0021BAAD24